MHTVEAPGSYTVNGGVIVRVFYQDADTTAMLTDAFPSGTLTKKGWFKSPRHSAAATVADLKPSDLFSAGEIVPIKWGVDQGVKYVEFQVTEFSTFGYFAGSDITALPVSLVSFKASGNGCTATIEWNTGVESNLSHYELQHSNSGSTWATIMNIDAKGSNSKYTATHQMSKGKQYYRLMIPSLDGTVEYSNVASVNANCDQASHYTVSPNPTNSELIVTGLSIGEQVHLFDVLGKKLSSTIAIGTQQIINVKGFVLYDN